MKEPTLGLLNIDGKGKGILGPVCGKRIDRGIIKRKSKERPTITAVPVKLHVKVSGTVGWAAACASNINLIKVFTPEKMDINNKDYQNC